MHDLQSPVVQNPGFIPLGLQDGCQNEKLIELFLWIHCSLSRRPEGRQCPLYKRSIDPYRQVNPLFSQRLIREGHPKIPANFFLGCKFWSISSRLLQDLHVSHIITCRADVVIYWYTISDEYRVPLFITSTTEGLSVCLSVCFFVCVRAGYLKRLRTDLDETWWRGWVCDKEKLSRFWWRSDPNPRI